ncbi:hypothetical protein BH24ACT5_BH24ACT5_10820 [soil metagenome]
MAGEYLSGPVDLEFGSADDEVSSDIDRTLLPHLTAPMSKRYEDAIRQIFAERVPDWARFDGTHLPGELSGIPRQIDVLLRAPIIDSISSVIVIECKHYARRVGIGTVDELYGKLIDVGAEHGVLCAPNGFTAPARERAANARNPKIVLYDLSGDDQLDVHDLPGPDCPSYVCEWGWVSWRTGASSDGETIGMGSCDRCGAISARCDTCGLEIEAGGLEECYCGVRFRSEWWHDGSEWIVRFRDGDDDEVQFDWASPGGDHSVDDSEEL